MGPHSFQACFCNLVVGPWHHMTPSDYCQLTFQMWRFQTQEASTFKHQGDVCWHGKILVGKFKFSTFAIYGTGNVSFYRDLAIRRHIMPPSAVFGAKYHFSSSSTKTPPQDSDLRFSASLTGSSPDLTGMTHTHFLLLLILSWYVLLCGFQCHSYDSRSSW